METEDHPVPQSRRRVVLEEQPAPPIRTRDPGVPADGYLGPVWVHCPRCNGPARETYRAMSCHSCGFSELANPRPRRRPPRGTLTLLSDRHNCRNRACRARLPGTGTAVRGSDPEWPTALVTCLSCGTTAEHGAYPAGLRKEARPQRVFWHFDGRDIHGLYLTRRVGRHELYVFNRRHLDLLDAWIGTDLRERSELGAKTMLTRLPRWMILASNRASLVAALADIRAEMDRAGLND